MKTWEVQMDIFALSACRVGPRQLLDSMMKRYKKRTIFRLKGTILRAKRGFLEKMAQQKHSADRRRCYRWTAG